MPAPRLLFRAQRGACCGVGTGAQASLPLAHTLGTRGTCLAFSWGTRTHTLTDPVCS